jgi:hypothetical protein
VQSGSQATGTITESLFTKLGVNALRTISGSGTIEVTMPLHNLNVSDSITISEADAVNGIAKANIDGARTVVALIDENTFTITASSSDTATASGDGGGAPKVVCSSATAEFEEQSFSAIRGYPAAVCFHEGRLWFGGSLSQPDGLWGSQSGEFFNFNTGAGYDNQSIQLSSSVGQLDSIKHLVSNRDLQVFTESSEFIVPAFENTPVTPTNAMIRRQTPYGASTVKPFVFDGATIYLQRSGTVVREFIFSDTEAAYIANGVSTLSSHLIVSPVQMTTLQAAISRPESYIFIVNNDGTIAVFNSNRAEKRAGWTQFTTKGNKSAAITGITQANPGVLTSNSHGFIDGNEVSISISQGMTELSGNTYLVSNSTTNTFTLTDLNGEAIDTSSMTAYSAGGTQTAISETVGQFHSICTVDERVFIVGEYDKGAGTKKYVLMEIDESLNMDMAQVYSGSSGVFDVSDEFDNGAYLDVISGNDYLGKFTVSSGNINVSAVDDSLSSVEIGIAFDINLKTNPLDIITSNGPTTGMLRGLGRVIIDLNNTLSVSVNDKKLEIRNVTDDFSQSRTAITGKKEFRLLGYSRDPQITITQSAPLPAQINSIIAEVQI